MAVLFKRQQQTAEQGVAVDRPRATALGRIPQAGTQTPAEPGRGIGSFLKRGQAAPAATSVSAATTAPAVATNTAGAKAQRHGYPIKLALPLRFASFLLLALPLLNLVLTVLGVMGTAGVESGAWPLIVGAVASLVFGAMAALLVADALPALEPRADGVAISSLIGGRVLPWARVVRLHSMDLGNERLLIFVEYSGRALSLAHRVASLLAGQGKNPGFFYTSDITGFEDLTRAILSGRVRAVAGARVEDLLDETAQMPLFSVLVAPERTLGRLAGVADEDDSNALQLMAQRHSLGRSRAIQSQAVLALLPVALFWVDRLTRGMVPPFADGLGLLWATVGLLVVGVGELFVVALATQALGENTVGRGEFDLPFVVYPYLQLVRVLGFGIAFALVAVKAPFVLALVFWLLGAALVAYLAAMFAAQLYSVNRNQSLLAGAASGAMQALVVLLFLMLRG